MNKSVCIHVFVHDFSLSLSLSLSLFVRVCVRVCVSFCFVLVSCLHEAYELQFASCICLAQLNLLYIEMRFRNEMMVIIIILNKLRSYYFPI